MALRPSGFFFLSVLRAADRKARPVQHVRVDHRCRDVAVPEQFLYGTDVRAGLEQVGGEAVPQRVAADGLRDIGLARRKPDGPLQSGFVQVVPPYFPRGRIDTKARGRKDLLAGPLPGRARVFPFEGGPEGRPVVA